MKKAIALSLLAGSLAFAQSGLMGGVDGIHQHNASTLGQWNFSIGTGGDITLDNWSLTRGGQYTYKGKTYTLNNWDWTLAGNFNAAIGLLDFLDVGVSLPLYYDHANDDNGPSGYLDMWTTSRGDLDLWLKVAVPFDSKSIFGLAAMFDFYIPTGENSVGTRPRHAWYLNDQGVTHPFSADAFAVGGTLEFTLDLTKKNIPFRWNTHAGFVLATGDGQANTLVYGTGVNWIPISWMDVFVEYAGEFRVQKTGYPREAMADPMVITPGFRFHLPWNIDFAMGLDMSVRALSNIGYNWKDEMDDASLYTIHYMDERGNKVTYGYVPTPRFAGTAALVWRFGGKDKDEDSDGINDKNDKCPHTPSGAVVDSTGCPLDGDKDGVLDGFDKCPGTPEGATIDSVGCPIDTDKDGVYDGLDKCPETKEGANVGINGCEGDFDGDGVEDSFDRCPNTKQGVPVDSTGCPKDSDKDGVTDDLDKCADTPAGFTVDSTGCPVDNDKDGIPDALDKCLNTPAGLPVDSVGCPADADKDGVPDALDKCPNTKQGAQVNSEGCEGDFDNDGIPDAMDKCPNTKQGVPVDTVGCPADADKDGVPDYLDKCAETPENYTVDNTGCPLDYDKDGIPDALDKCPNSKPGVPVDSTGCSSDTDKDGVADGIDQCENTPSGAQVDSVGCPLDADKDGVPDFQDKCPNTLEGVKIDAKGCPVNKKEDLELLKKGIQFKTGSSKLTKASYKILDDIVKLLKKVESAKLEVQGHTDNTGSEATNKKISQERADMVANYFIKKGIAADRVRAVGYGSEMPIADNNSKKNRAKNRRVELVPFE